MTSIIPFYNKKEERFPAPLSFSLYQPISSNVSSAAGASSACSAAGSSACS